MYSIHSTLNTKYPQLSPKTECYSENGKVQSVSFRPPKRSNFRQVALENNKESKAVAPRGNMEPSSRR